MSINSIVREVGEQISLITPKGDQIIVTILEDNKIGIEAPEGIEFSIEDLKQE